MIFKYAGDVYETFSSDLVRGSTKLDIPMFSTMPSMRWRGPKIEMNDWYNILAFFKTWDEHEVQCRMVMDKEKKTITPVVMNQLYGTGMSTRELPDPDLNAQLVKDGFIDIGTGHHHCNASAFASGVDKDNEQKQIGLHFTVGKLDEKVYDLDFRMTWIIPGVDEKHPAKHMTSPTCISDWFNLGIALPKDLPSDLVDSIYKFYISKPPPKEWEYPEEWTEKLHLPEKPNIVNHTGYGGWNTPHSVGVRNRLQAVAFAGIQMLKDEKYKAIPGVDEFTPCQQTDDLISSDPVFKEAYGKFEVICKSNGFRDVEDYFQDSYMFYSE